VPRERRSSGLLQWLSNDQFRFVHPAVQVYFAAATADVRALIDHAGESWWDPVIVLATGHLADPSHLIEPLLARGHTVLAALALAEVRPKPADVGAQVAIELLTSLGQGGREADRLAAIGLASLLGAESVGHTGVVAPALSALASDSAPVRAAAAAALARLNDPSAIAPLLTALGDPADDVRRAASEALASFGERTVQPLVRQLGVPNEPVRRAAVDALACQGPRAVPALVPLLDSPSPVVRTEAAAALAAIGAPAVPALLEALQQSAADAGRTDAQRQGVVDALTKIGHPAASALVPLYAAASPALSRRIVAVMHAMGLVAVAALAEVIATPEHPHTGAAAALLGELPEVGQAAAPHLVTALSDPRFEVRWEARRSLRRIGAPALEALLAALQGASPQLRWEAAEILLALPEPPVEQLTQVLTQFYSSDDVAGRRRAVQALGMLADPMVRQTVERALHDPDPLVRRSAIDQLGRMGDPAAAIALAERWPEEEDPDTAITILETLALVSPEMAIPTLLDSLAADTDRIRRAGADLLAEIGEPAVIPLVEALNARPADLDLEGALRVLDRVGLAARAGGRAPANLARTYHRMLVEPHDVDELIYLATTIEWWPPALELHRTFATAKEFLEYRTLGGLGSAEARLEWVDEVDPWLRPAARQAFRQLRMISQAVQYYNRGATRRAKEKGLLAAADRLNSLHAILGELGEPHTRVFHTVAEHWSGLVNQAIRELQGRADLDLDIRTEHVRIRDVDTAAVLVFELFNRGEGLASNVQLTLNVAEDGLSLQSSPTHFLPPLGQGDRMSVEFTVRRRGAGVVPVNMQVRYDDPQKSGLVRHFPREVRFFVEEAEYREIGSSPYIAGPPVKSPEMFYGRQATFTWIQENLSGTYQDNVLVLYGERRTGKTSVLYQLQYHLPPTYALVLVDLQSIAYALGSTSELLYAMARKVTGGLQKQGLALPRPDREAYGEHPIEEFEALGELISQLARDSGQRAVLIADEFDLLIEAVEDGRVSPYVFDCIRGLMQHQDGLSFIFAGAHKLSAMLKNPQSILFNTALRRKVSFLEPLEAERLIREPVAEVLWYDELAVEKILRVTAGQPYFIQYICHEIVNLARRDSKNFVMLRDVDRALQTTVQETTGIIRHSYMSLNRDGQIALAALGRVTDDGRPFAGSEDVVETLRQDGVTVTTRDLYDTLRQLAERDFITERGGDGAGRQCGFTMELVRVWLEQNDEYTRLLEELRG
jgi:HEAT repeat protein